jgi:hypothetical protein
MVNWGSVIPIIVALIGVSGVVIPAFSGTFFKPNLNIDMSHCIGIDYGCHGRQYINISNTGAIPATNLSLILVGKNKIISNITNAFSTVNVTLAIPGGPSLLEVNRSKPINSGFVELHVKKFVNGGGSTIRLVATSISGNQNRYSVSGWNRTDTQYPVDVVYATYDQGSVQSRSFYTFLDLLQDTWSNPAVYFTFLAYTIVIMYLGFRWRKHRKRKFLKQMVQDMMMVRRSVKNDPFSQELFYNSRTKHITLEINDYLRVDDFYLKVAERDSYINKGGIDNIELKELNERCLELARNALEKIDWSKYGLSNI